MQQNALEELRRLLTYIQSTTGAAPLDLASFPAAAKLQQLLNAPIHDPMDNPWTMFKWRRAFLKYIHKSKHSKGTGIAWRRPTFNETQIHDIDIYLHLIVENCTLYVQWTIKTVFSCAKV